LRRNLSACGALDIKLILLGLIIMWLCSVYEHYCVMLIHFFLCFRFVLVKGGDLPDSSDSVDVYFDGMMIAQ